MSRPRRHQYMPGMMTGFPPWEETCGGDIQSIYARKGDPIKWLKLGEMCLRCHVFYPVKPPAITGKYREQELTRLRNREP